MSNRRLKLKLYKKNNKCHWCHRKMVLTDGSGRALPSNGVTLEHLVSRLHIGRWVKGKNKKLRRNVLACSSCNHNRSIQEMLCLSRSEILKRSNGFSLSPRGNPLTIKLFDTAEEVLERLDKNKKANTIKHYENQ